MTSPDDDPEARIRELEQPLTDQARTSEFGDQQQHQQAGGYPYPPTPPPAPYGGTFPTAPLQPAGGFRAWWIVLAVFVVGAIALAAGIAIYSANMFSRTAPSGSSPSARPGITHVPTSTPGTPGAPTRAPGTTGPTSTAPPGATLTVSGIGKNETIACDDSVVSVSGITNTVTITGHCASLTVSGMNNTVTVD